MRTVPASYQASPAPQAVLRNYQALVLDTVAQYATLVDKGRVARSVTIVAIGDDRRETICEATAAAAEFVGNGGCVIGEDGDVWRCRPCEGKTLVRVTQSPFLCQQGKFWRATVTLGIVESA